MALDGNNIFTGGWDHKLESTLVKHELNKQTQQNNKSTENL